MMYLIGTKEQRKAFEDENCIPYFDFQDQTDPDTVVMYGKDDEAATLIVILGEIPMFVVQAMGEEGGIDSEIEYQDYKSALAAYDEIQAR